ncbi:hypothetical protein PF005_g10046 [Phytophthora fragariae]|uniref:Uncharacterized protein n=1 Tax=Phytophthora fragariae TaxID=53985 RepID=A0A6A3SEP6_9STRA|nr:hypothetical protein PF003_g20260 [Phytophthora fragariae]KAE8939008.1 hypothetical protein PF009_g11144 [Phytophthora fragariae]KAE9012655.1 hypothetical protein PF011_g8819 [Phytophthora fragariae]KAE9115035.1 hypothetical protein PF007_g10164 [Phytophthora fragariae]KAE9145913.1 hypothetical protein PF006_g9283 [Phytophthora fragariae]
MAGMNAYTSSLRNEKPLTKPYEEGVPFFVPQLSKVKTSIMCQGKSQKLLFKYETSGFTTSPLSPNPMPYRKQGNHALYSEENLKKRQKLLEDPLVLEAIVRFWETFPCIRRGGDTIPVHDYIDVFMKFYKALVAPSEFSIGEARCIVEKDWARDSIDGENMSKLLFFGSLFEVADIWTIDISAEEYASFLRKLYERVTMTIYDHVKLQWITAFAELDKIRSFDDPTPPDGDTDNQNLDTNKKTGALGPVSDDQRLPEILSGRRGQVDTQSNNEDWGTNLSDDFGTDDQTSHDRLFERSPTKTRLEQVLEAKRMRSDDDLSSESSKIRPSRLALPELSPQHVLLPIPSIYLNPDLTHVHEAERAARRRLRKNVKLAQRLRRITY